MFFSTEFTKLILKPYGEISITSDGNNVWILLEPLTIIITVQLLEHQIMEYVLTNL